MLFWFLKICCFLSSSSSSPQEGLCWLSIPCFLEFTVIGFVLPTDWIELFHPSILLRFQLLVCSLLIRLVGWFFNLITRGKWSEGINLVLSFTFLTLNIKNSFLVSTTGLDTYGTRSADTITRSMQLLTLLLARLTQVHGPPSASWLEFRRIHFSCKLSTIRHFLTVSRDAAPIAQLRSPRKIQLSSLSFISSSSFLSLPRLSKTSF